MSAFQYIAYKVERLDKAQTILKLEKFKDIDKYRSFYKILPAVVATIECERDIINRILDDCCKNLLKLLKAEKKPHKATVKKVINDSLKKVMGADVNAVNKDFGCELCWYLSDIAGLEMRKVSSVHPWGYWDVVLDTVKIIEHKQKPAKRKA